MNIYRYMNNFLNYLTITRENNFLRIGTINIVLVKLLYDIPRNLTSKDEQAYYVTWCMR